MGTEFLSPIICNIFFLAKLRAYEHVNVMAKFMMESFSHHEIPCERNPNRPSGQTIEDSVDIQLNPRWLAFPLLVITAKNPGLRDAPSSRGCLAEAMPPRLAGKICKHDAVKATKVLRRYGCEQPSDYLSGVHRWSIASVCFLHWNLNRAVDYLRQFVPKGLSTVNVRPEFRTFDVPPS